MTSFLRLLVVGIFVYYIALNISFVLSLIIIWYHVRLEVHDFILRKHFDG